MSHAIRSELLKLRTTRTFFGIVIATLALVALIAGAQAAADSFDRGSTPGVRPGHAHAAGAAGEQLADRRLLDRAAAVDHDDLVDGLGDLGQHVARHQDRAALGRQRA